MNFYQAMQLDVSVCKGKIRNAANPSERHKLIAALIVKDIVILLHPCFYIRPDKKIAPIGAEQYHFAVIHSHYRGGFILEIMLWTA